MEEAEEGPRPFTALLDTGLKRTSTGSKVFAVLKVGFFTSRCDICCDISVPLWCALCY